MGQHEQYQLPEREERDISIAVVGVVDALNCGTADFTSFAKHLIPDDTSCITPSDFHQSSLGNRLQHKMAYEDPQSRIMVVLTASPTSKKRRLHNKSNATCRMPHAASDHIPGGRVPEPPFADNLIDATFEMYDHGPRQLGL